MSNDEAIIRTAEQPNSRNSALKILVCYHKPYTIPPNDDGIFLPIHAGKALTDTDLHIQGDNELNGQPCDNISAKNLHYNELTVLYWAWKNLKQLYPDTEYVGLFHYRRFLALDRRNFFVGYINANEQEILDYKIDAAKVIDILSRKDVILGTEICGYYPMNIQFYKKCIVFGEYEDLKKVIKNDFPDYYDDFVNFFELNNRYHPCQLFIMRYDNFVKYCEWLFGVLSKVESMTVYRDRAMGYLGECLLNVYVRKNRMSIYHCDRYYFDPASDTSANKSVWSSIRKTVFNFMRICYSEVLFSLIKIAAKLSPSKQ